MLRIEDEKIEARQGRELRVAGSGPGEEAAEQRFALADSLAEAVGYQLSALSFRRSTEAIFLTSSTRLESLEAFDPESSFRSLASKISYSSSVADPIAICRKRPNSASPLLPQPSAILIPIDS
jgi:hypothetical protein